MRTDLDITVRVDWDTLEATAKVSNFHTVSPSTHQSTKKTSHRYAQKQKLNQANKQEIKTHTVGH